MRANSSKRRLNADAKRALAAETMRHFAQLYARKAQKGVEPNDRRYEREVECRAKRMTPLALDALLHGDGRINGDASDDEARANDEA